MPYYQTLNGSIHFLSEQDVANGGEALLPVGCVRMPDETAKAIERAITLTASAHAKREALLVIADRIVNTMEDGGMDITTMRAYRVALRNIPQQDGFPESISWPVLPQDAHASATDLAQINDLLG